MAKKSVAKNIIKKILIWLLLIAMVLSIFAYAFSVFAK